jgi:hypothetical protein
LVRVEVEVEVKVGLGRRSSPMLVALAMDASTIFILLIIAFLVARELQTEGSTRLRGLSPCLLIIT